MCVYILCVCIEHVLCVYIEFELWVCMVCVLWFCNVCMYCVYIVCVYCVYILSMYCVYLPCLYIVCMFVTVLRPTRSHRRNNRISGFWFQNKSPFQRFDRITFNTSPGRFRFSTGDLIDLTQLSLFFLRVRARTLSFKHTHTHTHTHTHSLPLLSLQSPLWADWQARMKMRRTLAHGFSASASLWADVSDQTTMGPVRAATDFCLFLLLLNRSAALTETRGGTVVSQCVCVYVSECMCVCVVLCFCSRATLRTLWGARCCCVSPLLVSRRVAE